MVKFTQANKSSITLKVNELEYIKIFLPQPIKDLFRYDEVTIKFYDSNNQEYIIFNNDFIIYALRKLISKSQNAINHDLKLHQSIKEDIGYMWSREVWEEDLDEMEYTVSSEGIEYWVGQQYILWSTTKAETWLYEKDDKLILEITPVCDWPNPERTELDYANYYKFIKNYKPYIITEVDKDKVKEWLKKAQRILKIVESNDSKYFINES